MCARACARVCDLSTIVVCWQADGHFALGVALRRQGRNREAVAAYEEAARLAEGARLAHSAGLQVNAGHGITTGNLPGLFGVPHLVELNIGHHLVSRSIEIGLRGAVAEMREVMAGYKGGT